MTVALANDPERTRRNVGLALYVILMLVGTVSHVLNFIVGPLMSKRPDVAFEAMGVGALLAFPPLIVYLSLPRLLDRYDPEPWWALALALAWGAIGACGIAVFINSGFEWIVLEAAGGPKSKSAVELSHALAACISAPLCEELLKGAAVFGMFYFLRREFDGVVDGVIYATFAALGFAATENVIYYARAGLQEAATHKDGIVGVTFLLRGVLSPWGHPLYTSMTGIGFGIARETEKPALRWLAPIGGYCFAAFLHFLWNGAATLLGPGSLLLLPLWFLFVLGFIAIVVALVARKGRIIRDHLKDEVLIGNLSQQELDLVASPIGRWRARMSYGGSAGSKFVAAAARLGLCKWHTARAMKGQKRTLSMDYIAPLRQELADLRRQAYMAMGRPMAPAPGYAQQGYGQQAYPPQGPYGQPPQR